MAYRFHAEAEAEFEEAIAYYESREPGLGMAFADEVQATIDSIRSFPDAWTPIAEDVRRCLTNRFPYGIIYAIESDTIFILAVMHLHRSPAYWMHRSP